MAYNQTDRNIAEAHLAEAKIHTSLLSEITATLKGIEQMLTQLNLRSVEQIGLIGVSKEHLGSIHDEMVALNSDCPGNYYPPGADVSTTIKATNSLVSCTKPRLHPGPHGPGA